MAGSLFQRRGGEELDFGLSALYAERAGAFGIEVTGMMAFTRIFRSASSSASTLVIAFTAALDEA